MDETHRTNTSSGRETMNQHNELTAEQVRQIADRVYAMLLRDLRIEQERGRLTSMPMAERIRN